MGRKTGRIDAFTSKNVLIQRNKNQRYVYEEYFKDKKFDGNIHIFCYFPHFYTWWRYKYLKKDPKMENNFTLDKK